MNRNDALKKLTRDLQKLAELADEHDVTLPNGALVGVLLASMAVDLEKQAKPYDEPYALNVAPRYTPGSPALVSRRTGEQVAREEKDAYEHHLAGYYGDAGKEKAQRLGLGRIVYERVREHDEGRGAKRRTVVTWRDVITGERYDTHP